MEIALDELLRRLEAGDAVLLDVRSAVEYAGEAGYPCDPRQGDIPGARHVPVDALVGVDAATVRELVGAPEGT